MDRPKPRTFDFQSKLPKLPIPSIDETCKTFVESCKPLLNEEQLNEAIKLTKEFQNSDISKKLQEQLIQYGKQEESQGKSWIEEWWLKYAYLAYRAPLPINSNWYVSAHPHPISREYEFGEKVDAITRTSIIMRLALEYKGRIEREELPIEMVGKKPLCMNQMTRIYGVTRIPREDTDELVTHAESKHMMIMWDDEIFMFDVYDKEGKLLSVYEIQSQLEKIKTLISSQKLERQPPIGKLTGMERTEWAKARKELISMSPQNLQNLQLIESAIMVFSFDNFETHDEDKRAKNSLVGMSNRWYDKSVNFISYSDGNMGANGEHSPSDAPAPASIFQWVFNQETKESYLELLKTRNFEAKHLPLPTHIKWNLQPSFEKTLEVSSFHILKLHNSVDLRTFRFSDYGTSFILGYKCPPDSWVQIAIQLAYYRLHHKLTAIYETGSTRGFYHGRTETVRSLTEKVGNFIRRFDDTDLTPFQKALLFQEAVTSHRDYLVLAVRGKAIDRHLLGLRLVAGGMGVKVPLFESFAFKETSTWRISTSNMNPSDFWFCGFGPVYEDGYGVCYCTRNNHLKFSITNFINNHGTSSKKFRETLNKTLYDMKYMILQGQNSNL